MDHETNNIEIEVLKNILKNSPDSLFLHKLDGNFIYANETAHQTRGYTPNDQMLTNIQELDVSKQGKNLNHNNALTKGGYASFETSNICKDGSIIDVVVDSNIMESNKDKLILSIIRNKDQMESLIDNDMNNFYEIIKNTKKGMVIENLGLITYINQKLCDLLGYDKNEILGHEYINFFNGIQEFSILDEIIKVKNGGKSTVTSKLQRKDGSTLWALTTISPLYNRNGDYIGNLSMHRDITKFTSLYNNK